MQKRWRLKEYDEAETDRLKNALRISYTLCKILVQRKSISYELAKNYFRPELQHLHDPYLMKDMKKAVDRISNAILGGEKILIYGDYDVDGTSSVACLYRFLHPISPSIDFYIPHRYKEGYGISEAGIEYAINEGISLIISLDCGIKSTKLVSRAADAGIDFIICDHHLPDDELPPAVAILNAKQKDCNYPYKELCGCGVTLKLIQALAEHFELPDERWQELLDLVAMATAADIVPMTGENRILTYYGLKRFNESPCYGLKALLQLSQLKPPIHVNTLVFGLAPRINAAGRMDDARKAVQLLIADNEVSALDMAEGLHLDNTDRKEVDADITGQALTMLEVEAKTTRKRTTVLYKEDWHKGVVGIVASRLIDHYYRPTIVLTKSGDKISGSARSVHGFNVYEAIHQCRDLLQNYGGHFYAAGLTMHADNLDNFMERFEAIVSETITEDQLIPELVIDSTINFEEISPAFYNIICQMEPFGPENLRPVFIAQRVYDTGNSKVVKEQHVKFNLKQDKYEYSGICFGLAEKFKTLKPNQPLDIVFTLDENEWNNTKTIQLRIIDFGLSDLNLLNSN